ncbi:MAG: tetratricopeptide repeat protein [Anaerolineae bacterium]|nr:MAG: tetratricopeptide repeat protein [Anaerolineae bacterium]
MIVIVALLVPGGPRDLLFNGHRQEMADLYNQGTALLSAGDYDGAITSFEALLKLAPDNAEAQAAGRASSCASWRNSTPRPKRRRPTNSGTRPAACSTGC